MQAPTGNDVCSICGDEIIETTEEGKCGFCPEFPKYCSGGDERGKTMCVICCQNLRDD